jgi:hypothetical protein
MKKILTAVIVGSLALAACGSHADQSPSSPPTIGPNSNAQDAYNYCKYMEKQTHTTVDCNSLKQDIQGLINAFGGQ